MRPKTVSNRTQYKIFAILLILVLAVTALVSSANPSFFQRFIGNISPVLAMLFAGVLGISLFSFLLRKKWFSIYKQGNLRASLRSTWLIILFATIAIYVDWRIVFPENINIPFPQSLLFYPAIAFFVEILFHILPIAILLSIATTVFKKACFGKVLWTCLTIVALLEPTFQVFFMESSPGWALFLIWVNLFLFNLAQLYIFAKYDFISMYLFRLIYYAIWHVAWGYLRLEWLF